MANSADWNTEELLILVKTYPQPSSKYRETTCVAAVNSAGQMRRIFPVPFRLLEGAAQFRKWEWVRARVVQTPNDKRPESFRVDADSIQRQSTISTRADWQERRVWFEPHIVPGFAALEEKRQQSGETLGILRPSRLLELEITPDATPDWTLEERERLARECLFDSEAAQARAPLRKVPFGFHYHYECETPDGIETLRHKITDWEVGALYWHCARSHGSAWETPFREKLETWMAKRDLLFLLGTVHRFPQQWLIVGLIYPPRRQQTPAQPTLSLFD